MQRITQLDGMRTIACIMVFLAHSALPAFRWFTAGGASAVMYFFVLSGFLYGKKDNLKPSGLDYVLSRRVIYLYVLGGMCTLVSVLIWHDRIVFDMKGILAVILCTFQLQTLFCWIISYPFCGVSWYLANMFIFLFFVPMIKKTIEKRGGAGSFGIIEC